NRGRQTSSGVMTINNTTIVSAPLGYESIGTLTIAGGTPGGTYTAGSGNTVLGGGSVTYIGGYNPANGQVTPGGTLSFGSGNMIVQGGFVRNNGTINGPGNIHIDY